jgi:hypothetical protein
MVPLIGCSERAIDAEDDQLAHLHERRSNAQGEVLALREGQGVAQREGQDLLQARCETRRQVGREAGRKGRR